MAAIPKKWKYSMKTKLSDWLWVLPAAALLLGGCTTALTLQPTPTERPAQTRTLPLPTPTLTPQPPTLPCPPTPTPTPTPEFINLEIPQYISPDYRWYVTTTMEGKERVTMTVSLDAGQVVWLVEDLPYEANIPWGFSFPVPFYWSKDGRYLYYTHRGSGDGCFAGDIHRVEDLFRLDLTNGEVIKILDVGGTWVAFSPDEQYLASVSFGASGIQITNLATGQTQTLDLLVRQEDIGMETDQRYIVWAPNSRSLVFVIMSGVCSYPGESFYNWTVRVDLNPLSQRVLLEKDDRDLVPVLWTEQNQILTRDREGYLFWMNPADGSVVPVE